MGKEAAEAVITASQQTPEEIAAAAAAATEAARIAAKQPYTQAEIDAFTPTSDIDLERVPQPLRPVIKNMTRDFKEVQKGFTKVSQENADLKKTPPTPEKYFEDAKKNEVFVEFLKNPDKVRADIYAEIRKARAADNADDVDYWTMIKDDFISKKIEVSEKQRQADADEVRTIAELGADAPALVDYAKTLGFSEREFKNKPALREAVKKAYHIANAAEIAARKEVKPNPQQVAAPAGRAGGVVDEGNDEEKILMNPDTPTDVRMSIWAKRKK